VIGKDNLDAVIKIIPLQDSAVPDKKDLLPLPVSISAAIHECRVLKTVNSLKDYRTQARPLCWTGFNQIKEIVVTQGPYPDDLIKAWQHWGKTHEGVNSCPDKYGPNDKFLVILMEYGGQNLETQTIKCVPQIASIIKQLVYAFALAESKLEFEHRDLYHKFTQSFNSFI